VSIEPPQDLARKRAERIADKLGDHLPIAHPGADRWRTECPVCSGTLEIHSEGSTTGYPLYYCYGNNGSCAKDRREQFSAAMARLGVSRRDLWSSNGKPAEVVEAPPPPPLPSDEQVLEWHKNLLSLPRGLKFLREKRGLTKADIEAYQIGYDGDRFTVPIRNENGELVNVRRYDGRNSTSAKWLSWKGSHASIFGVELMDSRERVVLCAGEFDMMVTRRRVGDDNTAVVTFTCGEGNLPAPEWLEHFRGKAVLVAYDVDDAGRKGARKVVAALRGVAASVAVVDLSAFAKGRDGYDLTDFFVKDKHTAKELQALLEEAPPIEYGGENDPRIDELVEQMREEAEQKELMEAARKRYAREQMEESGERRILTWEQIKDARPPEWQVEGMIPVGSFGMIFGRPSEFKSFLAVDLAASVATGTPWLGNEVLKSGPVAYVAAEGASGVSLRAQGWAKYHEKEPEEFRMVPEPVQLLDEADVEKLIAELEEIEPAPVLVVIDTLARSMVGGDENSQRDAGPAIEACGRIIRQFGCSVILVHHTNRDGIAERGSSAFPGAHDWMVRVSKTGQGGGMVVFTKPPKDGEEPPSMKFRMEKVDGVKTVAGTKATLVVELEEVLTRAVISLEKGKEQDAQARAVLAAIRGEKDPISLHSLRQPGAVDASVPKRKIEGLLNYLIADGAPVKRVKHGRGTAYVFIPSPKGVSRPWDIAE